ncbi:ABC transporter substrate-binding protein [Roseitranquillus sediminis]|uniref:ABC transporter substrate-binding protein n=1 Tax=Roseitranquillus sediminis TaxID=2809051 RepID=UPI001D0C38E2|nr:ABC transporter substrate-binding protein [Roseitranquillus sediminis]MBM9595430.1 ABC transporter substrate-binding protein [Roseitranquillus sediminis]
MKQGIYGAASLAVALGLSGAAHAGKEDDTVRWASDSLPSSIDYYQHTVREGIVMMFHIWDSLIYKDPQTGEYVPHLAESWEIVDDTTIELKLREDVVFHNGEPFNADDVVFTVDYVTTETLPRDIFFLSGAEKIDDYTVRLNLTEPFPPILDYLVNMLPIYPDEYYAEVGPDGMSREPVGTGPYRVTELAAGDRIVMEKFDDYFGGAKGQPSIGTLEFRRIGEFNTQAIELMTGGLDWIWRVPPDAAERLEAAPGIQVDAGELIRFGFIGLDAAGRSGDNPMTDVRVRRAINHAINREGIRDAMMGPGANLIDTACAPSQFGCIADQTVTYEYDPEKARQLLAEAGYPDGFSTEIYGYRERPIVEAIIGDLAAVGIDVNLNYLQISALSPLREEGQLPMWYQAWGSTSIGDILASTGHWFRHSVNDYARDDEVLALFEKGDTMDEDVRREAYAELLGIISEQAYIVPMFTYALIYAYNDELNFTPSPDEVPRFYNASWAE